MPILLGESYDTTTTPEHLFNGIFGSGVSIASGGRNATNGLKINNSSAVQKAIPSTPIGTIYTAFSIHLASMPTAGDVIFFDLRDGPTTQCDLRLTTTGLLRVTRNGTTLGTGSGVFALQAGVTYHIEFKLVIDPSAGVVEVRLNEVTVTGLNLTSQNTRATSNSTADSFVLTNTNGGGGTITFDDFVMRTDDWSGDVQVRAFLPTGIGATNQWTANGAATTREAVDDTEPNDDTDYASTATVNDLSLFTYDSIPVTSTILAVIPKPYAKKTDTGTAKIASTVRHSGVNYPGADQAPSNSSYAYFPEVLETNPGTASAWTPSDWNAPVEIGPKRTA